MKNFVKKLLIVNVLVIGFSLAIPFDDVYAAKGGHSGGGGHSSGHDGGSDAHHDSHSGGGGHSSGHSGGKGKGPKYMGGRARDSHKGHSDGGHGVEDDIIHGKHGKRWSDDWTGGGHDDGDEHDHDDDGHDH